MNVFYEDEGSFRIGAILADNDTSLQVEAPHGKRSKLKASNVLFRFNEPLSGFMEGAQKTAEEMDLDFLWECCGQTEFSYDALAREYFGHAPGAAESAAILLRLKPTGAGLTVVGDDAQAIYGFRAATVRNILDFPAHFQPPAAIVTLEQNYRSTQPILAASNAVIGLARERFTKTLRSQRTAGEKPALVSVLDDVGQANFVAETILGNREEGMALKEQAVLFRASHHSGMLEIELPHVWLRDTDSRNGTYLNGIKVGKRNRDEPPEARHPGSRNHEQFELQDGDEVRLGDFTLSVTFPQESPAELLEAAAFVAG